MTPEDIRAEQQMLVDAGYLAPFNARGRSNVDGVWGAISKAAYEQYMAEQFPDAPVIAPAPARLWWQTRRGQGVIKLGVGFVLGVVGFYWEPANQIQTGLLIDTLFAHVPTILEALGLTLGAWGVGQSAVGAAQAKAPMVFRRPAPVLSPRDVERVRSETVRARADEPSEPQRVAFDDARGHFTDRF